MSSSKSRRRDKDDSNNPDLSLTSIGQYMIKKTLGEGNFAKVKLATHRITNQEVAIKVIDKTQLDEKKLGKLYREVRIMKMLHHPNIVKLYEVIETKHTVFLVMEYASGGELYDYLVVHGKMKEKEARIKFRQILSAVSYCHKKRVIHRDLKAENLLLDANLDIKIADFGFSNYYDPDSKLDTFCGSPPYAAPELFQGRRYTGPEVDIWSLGVILYVLTTGCLPFDGKNLQEMRESVCRGKYRIPFYLSDGCEKLLRKFLVRDPLKRNTLEMLVDDSWINESFGDSPISTDLSEQVEEDESIIKIVEAKFKIDHDTVLQALRDNVYNDIAAVYYLLYYEKQAKPGISTDVSSPDIIQIASPTKVRESSASPTKPSMIPIAEDSVLPETSVPRRKDTENTEVFGQASTANGAANSAQKTSATASAVAAARRRRATIASENDPKSSDDQGFTDLKNQFKADAVAQANQKDPANNEPTPKQHREPRVMIAEDAKDQDGPSKPAENPEEAPKPRMRHNTIVGIFRGGIKLGGSPSEAPAAADGTARPSTSSSFRSGEDTDKPRSLRFTFNSNTTSSKHPDEIMQEVMRACNKNGITHRLQTRYLLECTWNSPEVLETPGKEGCKFEVEVCKLPRLNNLHGLRFKRLGGSASDYKDGCEMILNSTSL